MCPQSNTLRSCWLSLLYFTSLDSSGERSTSCFQLDSTVLSSTCSSSFAPLCSQIHDWRCLLLHQDDTQLGEVHADRSSHCWLQCVNNWTDYFMVTVQLQLWPSWTYICWTTLCCKSVLVLWLTKHCHVCYISSAAQIYAALAFYVVTHPGILLHFMYFVLRHSESCSGGVGADRCAGIISLRGPSGCKRRRLPQW